MDSEIINEIEKRDKIYKDGIVITTDVFLSFADRLRILFGRRLQVITNTDTENVIGLNQTRSRVFVQRFYKRRRRQLGYADTPKEKQS